MPEAAFKIEKLMYSALLCSTGESRRVPPSRLSETEFFKTLRLQAQGFWSKLSWIAELRARGCRWTLRLPK